MGLDGFGAPRPISKRTHFDRSLHGHCQTSQPAAAKAAKALPHQSGLTKARSFSQGLWRKGFSNVSCAGCKKWQAAVRLELGDLAVGNCRCIAHITYTTTAQNAMLLNRVLQPCGLQQSDRPSFTALARTGQTASPDSAFRDSHYFPASKQPLTCSR